jgi:hypothetical protein
MPAPQDAPPGWDAADTAGAADYNRPTRVWPPELRAAGRGGFTENQVTLLAAKEMGMRKGLTRAATCLLCGLLLGAVGCGSDDQDQIISRTLTTVDEVSGNLSEINKTVREAITANDKKNQKIGEKDEYLLRAFASAQELRKLGERLQRLKELSDILKEKTSPEHSKELADRYRNKLHDKVLNLEKEERALDVTLAEADEKADASGKRLLNDENRSIRAEIKKGREAFEVLTKQR